MDGAIGQPVRRKEDHRLLTGKGEFSDDHSMPNQCWAVMVRCPFAHAAIQGNRHECRGSHAWCLRGLYGC